ncbi:MAG: bifunctional diaminohydroxyphosphoribosylaminopyrimidine deaminase/5-amino-6-(5-phosphoribosylamino)uracil reductase RibD [Gallionellaceae bacterium]|jgi:diaminohydroxyphosphoribosylaminopyrimidine deaminase/5-amino-6-(5-phosphoribosylamino)uracil reductase
MSPVDSTWMARALHLAERGLFTTTPNPRVGCVIVKDGINIGEAWHERAGEPHAEPLALRAAGNQARGATAYVTLEPCSHFGRTPPCADALIDAGVARVVIAMQDPNPLVAGQGIAKLRAAGIVVECGLMEAEAGNLNIGFVTRMTTGLPWVRSKIAASLDGRTALSNGASQWITGATARRDVHALRARSCAVLTGIDTVLADDAQLSVRQVETSRQPLRVVLDSHLRISPEAKIFRGGPVLIVAAIPHSEKIAVLEKLGAKIIVLEDENGRVDLAATMRYLAANGCNEVLVEAGSTLNGSLIKLNLINELYLYFAPQLLGDLARGMAQLGELSSLEDRVELAWQDVRQVGNDLRIIAKINEKCSLG